MDRHHEYTTQNDLENANNLTQNYQNRTSFLIEDILYRQKNDANPDRSYENPMQIPFNRDSPKLDNNDKLTYHHQHQQVQQIQKGLEKPQQRLEKPTYNYFQPGIVQNGLGCVQSFQGGENGYIQVMGALGAYLQTPYKNMTDPYFLTQGNLLLILQFFLFESIDVLSRSAVSARIIRNIHGDLFKRFKTLPAEESPHGLQRPTTDRFGEEIRRAKVPLDAGTGRISGSPVVERDAS